MSIIRLIPDIMDDILLPFLLVPYFLDGRLLFFFFRIFDFDLCFLEGFAWCFESLLVLLNDEEGVFILIVVLLNGGYASSKISFMLEGGDFVFVLIMPNSLSKSMW